MKRTRYSADQATPERNAPARERDLWQIWEERRLPVALRTRDGQDLRVLFPGVANTDAGPDFVGAFLALDNASPQRGDVELHLRAVSWERHGHHQDTRYDRVILHVVLLDDGGPARTSAGVPIPLLTLGPILAQGWEAGAQSVQPGSCHRLAADRASVPGLATTLLLAGMERFDHRVTSWQTALQTRSLEDCVLLALLRSAGLGRNEAPCAALAAALDGVTLEAILVTGGQRATATAAAVLLGMAGLLELAHADQETRDLWLAHQEFWPGRPLSARAWRRFRVRPANFPESRLRLVAALAGRAGLQQFLADVVDMIRAVPAPSCGDWMAMFNTENQTAGRSWTLEALASVWLPLATAYARDRQLGELAERAVLTYVNFAGGGDNAVLDRMARIAGLHAVPRRAVEQQGLLHLWSTHCSRQQCETCPLAADRL